MTENNAAHAADQEIEAIMEQAQVFASAWAFLGGPFDNGSGLEQAERERSNLRALLSKLRAEGVQAGDERAAFASHVSGRDDLELYQVENVIDANSTRWATWRAARDYYQQARAALASAPTSEPFDAEVLAERLRDLATSHYETAMGFGISRDNFERCAADAAKIAQDMASAPVAGEDDHDAK